MPDIFDASANRKPTQAHSISTKHMTKKHDTTHESAPEHSGKIMKPVDEYSMVMRDESPSNNPFLSYLPKPEKIFFASQHFEEKVLLLLRQHPVTQVGWMIVALFLAVLPFLFISVGLLDFLPPNYQFASLIGWYLLIIGYVLQSFLGWFYNVYLVTDERLVDVDFHNLLYKDISSAKIDRIEDVTTQASGILASVFDYGTVKIQTAGTSNEFEFENVPHPARIAAFLNEMIVEEEKEKNEGRAN
jgi:hypothetical protein